MAESFFTSLRKIPSYVFQFGVMICQKKHSALYLSLIHILYRENRQGAASRDTSSRALRIPVSSDKFRT